MVVFNEAYFRIPIIGYFSFVCAEKHTKSFAVDIFFYNYDSDIKQKIEL